MTFEQFLNTTFVENDGMTEEGQWRAKHIEALQTGLRQLLTLGGHTNVDGADGTALNDYVLYKAAGSQTWTVKQLSEIKPVTDSTPAQGSENPVTSGGVWASLEELKTAIGKCATAAELQAAVKDIGKNAQDIATLSGNLATLAGRVTAAEGGIATLGGTVTGQGTRIAAIEQQLAAGVGAKTLGGLENVDAALDEAPAGDMVLVQLNGQERVTRMDIATLMALMQPVTYAMKIVNLLPQTALSITDSDSCLLRFKVTSQVKDNTVANADFTDTGEQADVAVEVRNGSGEYVRRTTLGGIETGVEQRVDVTDWLELGANSIRLRAMGVSFDTQATAVWTVQVSSLGLDISLFDWTAPVSGDFQLPYRVSGNVEKTLHVAVASADGETYRQGYELNLGGIVNAQTARYLPLAFPGATGLYTLTAWLESNDGLVVTARQTVQFACLVEGDAAKLLVVNNVASGLTNWSENRVLDYVLWDTSTTAGTLTFTAAKGGQQVYVSRQSAVDRTRHTLVIPLEVDTGEESFELAVTADDGAAEPAVLGAWTLPTDNSVNYAATDGAVFHLNPAMRSNGDANREKAVNAVTGEEIDVEWTGVSFSATDAWTTDDEGVRCLKLRAGQRARIKYNVFPKNAAQGAGKTIDIDYKMENVSDYGTVGIDISKPVSRPSGADFAGLRIGPNLIFPATTYSSGDEDSEAISTDDGDRLRVSVSIVPRAYTYTAGGATRHLNLVRVFIDGGISRVFQIDDTDDLTLQDGQIVIGSDDCDVTLYGLRVYDSALQVSDSHQNYVNMLSDNAERAEEKRRNDVYDANGQVSFAKVKSLGMNMFVSGKPLPSFAVVEERQLGGPGKVKETTYEFYLPEEAVDYVKTQYVEDKGQGTSSMYYFEWNQQTKTLDATFVTYGTDGEAVKAKKYTLFQHVPKMSKFVAKKNWASCMQDHKCGGVNLWTDAWKAMGFSSPAVDADGKARVSVYQEPMAGWVKTEDGGVEGHTYMGNFTGGPAKGDSGCFGYDTGAFPELISIEGSDNDPMLTNFKMPWDESQLAYDAADESVGYHIGGGQYKASWDIDGGDIGDPDEDGAAAVAANVFRLLRSFVPAYNAFYSNNIYIRPFAGTAEELNAALREWKAQREAGTLTNDEWTERISVEYWLTGDYGLYYYNVAGDAFVASTVEGVQTNLQAQLGLPENAGSMSAEELNAWFVEARVARFKGMVEEYWDVDDLIYLLNMLELLALSDNTAKNLYFHYFGNSQS